MSIQPKVAYLVNQYPGISHTFIRREIMALEKGGVPIKRFALRGWADALTDPTDEIERSKTRYVLQAGFSGLLSATLRAILASPSRALKAWRAMWAMHRDRDRPLVFYLAYFAEAAVLARWLKQDGIAHLHAHFGTNSASVALLAQHLSGIGFSFTVHGPEEFDRPAAISLSQKIACARFVVAISSFGRSQLFRWTERRDWPKICVVHCGLDHDFYSAAPMASAQRPATDFVCVGRICEQKGQLLLIEAMAGLAKAGVRATLVLAGDGPMRKQIESRAEELGVRSQLRITGWINSAQVRDELLAARAMVLPSFAEGLPVVIMEAMALRRPVISTYVAGNPELVLPGLTGWLVPAGDVQELTHAMLASRNLSWGEWTSMGEAAQVRALQRHDIDTEAAKLAALFLSASRQPESAPAEWMPRHVD